MPSRHRPAALFLLAALSAPATVAQAQTLAVDGASPPPAVVERIEPAPRRFDSRAGLMLGGADVADANGFSVGIHAALGYRVGATTAMAEYQYYRVGDGGDEVMQRRGRASRVGLALRRSLLRNDPDRNDLGADLWVEGGLGYERIAWHAGGLLPRPDLALGLGIELGARMGPRDQPGHHVGYFLAFRALLARGPDGDEPAMCGGPCTIATPPPRNDASLFFVVGLHVGRGTR